MQNSVILEEKIFKQKECEWNPTSNLASTIVFQYRECVVFTRAMLMITQIEKLQDHFNKIWNAIPSPRKCL